MCWFPVAEVVAKAPELVVEPGLMYVVDAALPSKAVAKTQVPFAFPEVPTVVTMDSEL